MWWWSYSHGTALNWIYRHIVKKRQPCYFGCIDHDLFPIKPVCPVEHLARQPIYGIIEERGRYWYLWAGFCLFRFDFVRNKKIDFLPTKPKTIYLDTGGSNWYSIYSKINKTSMSFASSRCQTIVEKENGKNGRINLWVEYLDDTWLHTAGASNYAKIAPEQIERKEDAIWKILKKHW
ncbi:MAG: hypothetical protein LBS46_09425 [Dysgonamonadaceae bacterium]|jgi:hypothetical protein|nr:hypothetical protein [Dysgonamonadaceae bacterium]